jgi:hypothetical protein
MSALPGGLNRSTHFSCWQGYPPPWRVMEVLAPNRVWATILPAEINWEA